VSATGGSTNFVLHSQAIAKILNLGIGLKEFDEIQSQVPVIAKFKPSSRYTLYDYYKAGGVAASLQAIRAHLDVSAERVMGGTLGRRLLDKNRTRRRQDANIIHSTNAPLHKNGCFSILIRQSGTTRRLAVVKKSGVSSPSMFPPPGTRGASSIRKRKSWST
jgi:dihydroxy-acid dehydratase